MPKEKRKPRAYRSLAWRIAGLTFALWMACMGILTWCVASDMQMQLHTQTEYYIRTYNHDRKIQADEVSLPGAAEYSMIRSLGFPYISIRLDPLLPIVHKQILAQSASSDDWLWGKWDLFYGFEPAVIYYDSNKALLVQTGDYLTFDYTTQANWHAKNTEVVGKGYIALDAVPGGAEFADRWISDFATGDPSASMFLPVLRLTGYFEGNEFHPTVIDRGSYYSPYGERETLPSKLAELDSGNRLTWETILTTPADGDVELETIYAWELGGLNTDPKSVTVNGETFASLADLLYQDTVCGDPYSYEKGSLLESVFIERRSFEDTYGPCTIAIAVRCKPLQYACIRLIGVYVISLIVVAVCLWLLLRRFKKHYTLPLERMAHAARAGIGLVPISECAEVSELENHVAKTHQTLSENKAELQQLRTALDYARDAEERRKQLVSNITHELKTPLAIIHSYAECLQEETAEETRERYLETILDETERMDAMVVQMLDLSRLEAGKVRFASDHFSLSELIKVHAKKMQPLFEARGLTLYCHLARDFTVTADEARITQVITNLLSNAQKYTTEGGMVRIRLSSSRPGYAYFYVENTAPHLSSEALEKLWDSFYRVDESRNTAGIGLGLSLVKSIITLHGGTYAARNITFEDGSKGIRFSIVLPLK